MTPKIDDSVALSTSDGVSSLGRTSSVGRNSMHYAYSLSNSVNGVIKDRVLRVHTGPVDQKARSMRDPLDLLMDLEALFEKYGWIIETNGSTSGEYKLRVVKPRGVKVPGADSNVPDTSKQNVGENASEVTAVDVPAIQQDPKMTQIVESLPVTLMKRIRNFVYTLGPSASKGYDGSKSNVALSKKAVTGMEEEMTFNVEIKRVRETKRSLVVEFRRVKGDVWGFKRLYVSVIDKLPLSDN
ncbi:hypothetical protein HK100_012703 [Physocladia obscura]|uniref:KA1 domain-containing protein n=1 Tax=Physocladia obscura TaxID=109957 RepID=A0AAD5SZE5_9FUNG|nr:hypothetical protein HK100_012703 [Physocladia obscura]